MTRSLSLALVFLTGCTPMVTKVYPPQELIANCEVTGVQYNTNEELAVTAARLAGALRLCNIDKRKLREWSEQ